MAATTAPATTKKKTARSREERRLAWMLCAPAVIVMLLVTGYPIKRAGEKRLARRARQRRDGKMLRDPVAARSGCEQEAEKEPLLMVFIASCEKRRF